MATTCSHCGTTTETADDTADESLPPGWSLATGRRGVERLCHTCTRSNIRAIEAKLPEEWWE